VSNTTFMVARASQKEAKESNVFAAVGSFRVVFGVAAETAFLPRKRSG
jgi:hypothetical protein